MTNIDMVEAVRMLAADRGIPVDTLLQVLADALVTAYKRRPDAADEAEVQIDAETMDIRIFAYDIDEFGELVNGRDDTPDDMGRIAAQTFRQVLSQRIREVERDRKFEEYANREGDIVTGIIQQRDNRYTLLDLGKVEALLPQAEQVPFERPEPSARLKAYIVEVRRTPKGPQIVVSPHASRASSSGCSSWRCPRSPTASSRSRPAPASPGTARRSPSGRTTTTSTRSAPASAPAAPGSAWWSPSCGARRSTSSPSARTSPTSWPRPSRRPRSRRSASTRTPAWPRSSCPDFQLSLAIGKEGQNARLAARLTGWRVDIKSETQLAEEDAGIYRSDERYEREEGVEYAEGEWVPNAQSGELEWHAADGTVVSAQEWAAGDADAGEGGEGEVEAAPTDATVEEAAGATEEAAEEALAEEVAIEADLDPIQDAADAEAADRAAGEADDQGGDEAAASDEEPAGDA